MASLRNLIRAFSSGELAPEVWGRVDLAKFQSGLATCRNFIPLPHGPAINRAGFAFVRETKNSAAVSRMIPFSYNNTQAFAIEVGAGYFRFHTQGAVLLAGSPGAWVTTHAYAVGDLVSNGGTNYYCKTAHTSGTFATDLAAGKWYAMPATGEYEIPNPYAAADLFTLKYTQSADVLTLTHTGYPVQELRRYGATNWQLAAPTFQAPTNCPTSVAASATGTGSTSYQYVVTTVNQANLEESIASAASAAITNNLSTAGNKNTITWTASATGTPIRYNIYSLSNGLYGYIGQADGSATSFVDNNITPDVSKTPPINDTGFNDAVGNYPGAVAYYEQRRCYGGTANKPQNFWATRSGTESNLSYTIPTRDDNRIAFRIAAREASAVRHIVPVANLLLLTASCEWRVTPVTSDALTPTSASIRPQSYIGANDVTPVVVGNSVLFAQARGGHVRELAYNWQAQGYLSQDISLLAPHLFDYLTVVDMAYSKAPYPILWAVSSNGKLLGMTYVPEQQVASWHWHDTDGTFESICSIAEGNMDVLYAIVNRTINGQTKRYVECMHTRQFSTLADAFFVDCGATYSGAPATNISGLTWLEGKTVNILADGAVVPPQVVTGGAITLSVAASKVQVGLPITADIQTLPAAGPIDGGMGQGRLKNVNRIWLRCYRSSGILAGPDFNSLVPYKQRTTETYGSPPNVVSDEVEIALSSAWQSGAQVCVRQTDPLPLTLVSMTMEIAIGG
ncbi:MAG: hypothetical protein JSR19_06965 [Proteobacteria bacterium]|nr:hypothetical protein [Pseudomonadota bacterium]